MNGSINVRYQFISTNKFIVVNVYDGTATLSVKGDDRKVTEIKLTPEELANLTIFLKEVNIVEV